MRVCLLPISSGTAGPIWLNFFLLAPSWSRDGFRPKKFRIRDPDFPEIRKTPAFRVFSGITHLDPNMFKHKLISGLGIRFSGSGIWFFPEKSGKIGQKSGLTVYHDVIHHFSYSNHGKFIFGTQFAIWRIFSKFLEDFSR